MNYKASFIGCTVLLGACVHAPSNSNNSPDPFAWMQTDQGRLKIWLEKELADTNRYLEQIANRGNVSAVVSDTFRSEFTSSELKVRGRKLFFKITPPESEAPSYAMSEDGGRTYSVILDAQTLAAQKNSILWAEPDNSGQKIFFGLSKDLDEVGEGRIFDVDSRAFEADVIKGVSSSTTVTFLPDGRSLIYSSKVCHATQCSEKKGRHAYLHVQGRPQSEDKPLFGPGLAQSAALEGDEIVGSLLLPGPGKVLAWAYSRRKSSYTFYSKSIADLSRPEISWQRMDTGAMRVTHFDAHDSAVSFGLMDDVEKKVKIGQATWPKDRFHFAVIQTLENEFSIDTLTPTENSIVVLGHKGMRSSIRVINLKSRAARDMTAPLDATYAGVYPGSLKNEVIVEEQSYGRQSRFLRMKDLKTFEPLFPSLSSKEISNLVVAEDWAKSEDGTQVPMTILYKKDRVPTSPTLLSVYGSYGISKRPKWDPKTVSWLQLGGTEVICHVRGGGELGEAWHEGGKRRNKIKSIQDAKACAETLTQSGFTSPEQLALISGSAGGVISNNLAVTSPNLFQAVVTRVGLAHLTALHLMPSGAASVPELGDIRDAADREAMEKIDPYLLVKPDQQSPALFLTIGWNDSRVLPWQPAKFAARIQSTPTRAPVLVRTDFHGGHGLVTFTKSQQLQEWSDIAAFLLRELASSQNDGIEIRRTGIDSPPKPDAHK